MADRLSIDNEINEKVIPELDKTNLLGLGKTSSDRTGLFMFAMALGVKEGKRTPLSSKHGFILEASIKSFDGAMSLLFSLLVQELQGTNEEEKIDNKDYAFMVAEEYANTGFQKIKEWVNHIEDEESVTYSLIEELDAKYEELFGTV